MRTNGFCSVFRAGTYAGTYRCMWQGARSRTEAGHREKDTDSATVFIPSPTADVRKGDAMFFGVVDTVSDAELYNALTVHEVILRNYGSKRAQHTHIDLR